MKLVVMRSALFIVALFLTIPIAVAQTHSVRVHANIPTDPNSPSNSTVEDFSSASLAGSQLHPDPPEPVDKNEQPDFIMEFIHVQWRPGDPIDLYVVRPAKVQKPPVVIYLYGHPSETDRFRDEGWCRRTTSGGYAAVGFVPALTGHRYHDRPMKQWFVSELQEALGKSTHDVQMVLNYLAQRGDVDMNNVGMFGVGAGGTIAVLAASVDPRIKVIDLLDPWGDWPTWMAKSDVIPEEERPAYVKPEFLKKIANFDPIAVLPKLTTTRIRLNQLNDDFDSTPEEAKKRMEAALPSTAASHRFESSAEFYGALASGGRVFDWLKLQLKMPDFKDAQASKAHSANAQALRNDREQR